MIEKILKRLNFQLIDIECQVLWVFECSVVDIFSCNMHKSEPKPMIFKFSNEKDTVIKPCLINTISLEKTRTGLIIFVLSYELSHLTKSLEFFLDVLLCFLLLMIQHWFRRLGAICQQAITWTNDGQFHICIYASPSPNELIFCRYFGWASTKTYAMLSLPRDGAFDLGLAVSVPLPIVTGIFVLLWFQSRLT